MFNFPKRLAYISTLFFIARMHSYKVSQNLQDDLRLSLKIRLKSKIFCDVKKFIETVPVLFERSDAAKYKKLLKERHAYEKYGSAYNRPLSFYIYFLTAIYLFFSLSLSPRVSSYFSAEMKYVSRGTTSTLDALTMEVF